MKKILWVTIVAVLLITVASQPVLGSTPEGGSARAGYKYVMYSSGPQPHRTCTDEYICPQPVGTYSSCEEGTDFGPPWSPWFIREHCEWAGDDVCFYFQEIWWGGYTGCGETLNLN